MLWFVAGLACASPPPTESEVLADHPGGAFTLGELRVDVEEKPADRESLRKTVRDLAIKDYGIALAVEQGLDQGLDYTARVTPARTRLLSGLYYERYIRELSKPTPEEVEKALDERLGILYPQPLVFEIRTADRTGAEAARERVLAGEAFKAVASEISQGIFAKRGGAVGYLVLGSGHYTEEVEDLLMSMEEGDVSEVIPGPLGYSVFGVKRVRSVAEQQEPYRQRVEEATYGAKTQQLQDETFRRLAEEADVVVHWENLESPPPPGDLGHSPVVAEVDGELVFLGDDFFNEAPPAMTLSSRDQENMLNRYVMKILFRNEAVRLGLDRDPAFLEPFEPIRRDALWRALLQEALEAAEVGEDALLRAYNADRALWPPGATTGVEDPADIPEEARSGLRAKFQLEARSRIVNEFLERLGKQVKVREKALGPVWESW